jgi:hypothetical protein
MRDCESMPVLRINASRTVWPEIRSGRLLAQNTELPREPAQAGFYGWTKVAGRGQ